MTQFLAGMVPTADELNGLVAKTYVCTATLTKTSDTAMEEVPGLTFSVESGYIYYAAVLISYTGPTAGDIQFDWTYTGSVQSADIRRFIIGLAAGTTTNLDSNVAMPRRDGDTDQAIGADAAAGTSQTSYIEHTVIIPTGDGTVSFRAAQATSNGTPTTVSTASRIVVTRGLAG